MARPGIGIWLVGAKGGVATTTVLGLAAPLVLDLVRFTELAPRRGDTGRLTFLASFFKSPYGVDEHDFARQSQMLEAWAARQEAGK